MDVREIGRILIHCYAAVTCLLATLLGQLLRRHCRVRAMLIDWMQVCVFVSGAVHLWAAYGGDAAAEEWLATRLMSSWVERLV